MAMNFKRNVIRKQRHTGAAANGDRVNGLKTLITSGSDIKSQSNEQSHELNAGRSEARQLVQQMKETVRNQLNPVNSQISAASLQLVQDQKATQLSLPSRSALTRTLNRSKQTTSLPTIATDDRHFEKPDRFKQFCFFF